MRGPFEGIVEFLNNVMKALANLYSLYKFLDLRGHPSLQPSAS